MTPEEAKALLEAATPGPWEVEEFEEQYAGCPPTTEFYLGSDDFQNIASAETTERHYDQTRANFALIAAAPDLAETVARLRFMYGVAVEMPHGIRYLAEDMDGDIWAHSDPHFPAVMWFEWDKDAEDVAVFWNKDHPEHATARVVRRLVGDPEVVDE